MLDKIIEATNVGAGGLNWGKFMVCKFTLEEWCYRSRVDSDRTLLRTIGIGTKSIWVLDLQTGEGALFKHGGLAAADLHKHRVWVCPLFEQFLTWLYRQDVTDLAALPDLVNLDDPASAIYGYRRAGT